MKERLAQFLVAENITRNDFANHIGVQRSNITHILDGRNKPSFDFIEKMLTSYPQINAEWLILGHGDMYKKAAMGSLFAQTPPKPTAQVEEKKEHVNIREEDIPSDAIKQKPSKDLNHHTEIPTDILASSAMASKANKQVECIIILYTDKTFDTYTHA